MWVTYLCKVEVMNVRSIYQFHDMFIDDILYYVDNNWIIRDHFFFVYFRLSSAMRKIVIWRWQEFTVHLIYKSRMFHKRFESLNSNTSEFILKLYTTYWWYNSSQNYDICKMTWKMIRGIFAIRRRVYFPRVIVSHHSPCREHLLFFSKYRHSLFELIKNSLLIKHITKSYEWVYVCLSVNIRMIYADHFEDWEETKT